MPPREFLLYSQEDGGYLLHQDSGDADRRFPDILSAVSYARGLGEGKEVRITIYDIKGRVTFQEVV